MTTGNDTKHPSGNPEKLSVEALTDQAAYDKLIATGRAALAPMAIRNRQTDWNGLTPKQEEEARLHSRQQVLAEYERQMEEIRERTDRLEKELDNWERDLRKRQAEADANDIVLHDGRHVLVGPNNSFTDKLSGQRLQAADEEEARKKKTDKSTTTEQDRKNKAEWDALGDAKERLREARSLTSRDGTTRSPEEIADASKNLAVAEAEAKARGVPDLDVGNDANFAASLGLSTPEASRTASFAGTLDAKDSRSTALQDRFAASVQGADTGNLAPPASSGTTAVKKTDLQQNNKLV